MVGRGGAGQDGGATTAGERLLRSEEAQRAAASVALEVEQQLAAALHGPVGTALAAGAHPPAAASEAPAALLGAGVPRRFIAAGAALTAAYVAVAAGDEHRAAGALLCAQRTLFPDDPLGVAAVAAATRLATAHLEAPEGDPAAGLDAEAMMQRRVAADVESLERAYLAAAAHLQAAAAGSVSWKRVTGGASPGSAALAQLGPFVDGLVRWAFYVEVALQGIRADDWARAGAALIAARRVTQG